MRVPVVKIRQKEDGRIRIIDAEQFDDSLHDMYDETVKESKPKSKSTKKSIFSLKEVENGFIIVNSQGEQQGEIFDNEDSAKLMLKILSPTGK